MLAIVTCGPSYEPVDRVRRLTSFSTGELGVMLAERLTVCGVEVWCFKGEGGTHRDPKHGGRTEHFSTNDDLWERLHRAAVERRADAVFHAAALADYRVARVEDKAGRVLRDAKIPSRSGGLVLHLEPARKVIAGLRDLFPSSWLVGWKYEMDGGRQVALERAWRQLVEYRTNVCVANGAALGPGFAVCEPPDRVTDVPDKATLVEALMVGWLRC